MMKVLKKLLLKKILRYNFMMYLYNFGKQNIMMIPNKKTKQKNIFTALAIVIFMIFLFFFTLYNVGVFDRQI